VIRDAPLICGTHPTPVARFCDFVCLRGTRFEKFCLCGEKTWGGKIGNKSQRSGYCVPALVPRNHVNIRKGSSYNLRIS
jgi:hypothetical protein